MLTKSQRVGGVVCLWLGLVGCNKPDDGQQMVDELAPIEWQLATSWPKGFPGLGLAAEQFSDLVGNLSQGRLVIQVYGAGELVPSFDVFDAVSKRTVEMGHSAAYYWQDKMPAASFFSAVPFGMTAREMNAWLYQGEGLTLWQELYAPFGVLPLPGGNTGAQMGGWFNKEINSAKDVNGITMRLSGYAIDIFRQAGGVPVSLPGGELFTALETGAIDAAEWVGPYNDLAFGLHHAAKYYYYPGWQEPSAMMELLINQEAFAELPPDLKAIVITAAQVINQSMQDDYTVRNVQALKILVEEHGTELRPFPNDVLVTLEDLTWQVLEQKSTEDPHFKRIYLSYRQFLTEQRLYTDLIDKIDVNKN